MAWGFLDRLIVVTYLTDEEHLSSSLQQKLWAIFDEEWR